MLACPIKSISRCISMKFTRILLCQGCIIIRIWPSEHGSWLQNCLVEVSTITVINKTGQLVWVDGQSSNIVNISIDLIQLIWEAFGAGLSGRGLIRFNWDPIQCAAIGSQLQHTATEIRLQCAAIRSLAARSSECKERHEECTHHIYDYIKRSGNLLENV